MIKSINYDKIIIVGKDTTFLHTDSKLSIKKKKFAKKENKFLLISCSRMLIKNTKHKKFGVNL